MTCFFRFVSQNSINKCYACGCSFFSVPDRVFQVLVDMTMAGACQQQPDTWYVALLGLAEHFRTSNPPDIKLCIHCLQTVFTFKPSPNVEARTHLQIGTVLSSHTKNVDLALTHLDHAV